MRRRLQGARINNYPWELCLLVILGVSVAIGSLILLLGPISSWATPTSGLHGIDKFNALNTTRQTLLAGTGGAVVLAGGVFTARTYYLSRRGQLTDRYAKAISLLASDKITERIGGIYALEHLMIESGREHETVIEVLAAFIRERTGAAAADEIAWDAEHHHQSGGRRPRLDIDVQTAVTVIGRRPRRPERHEVDLSQADLCGADLSELNFDNVWFWRTRMRSAKLLGTSLRGANLAWAQLQESMLTNAQMQGAHLIEARLQEATLIRTQLQRADMENAHLENSYLGGANLQDAILKNTQLQGANLVTLPIGKPILLVRGLEITQLESAVIDDKTRLPDDLSRGNDATAAGPIDENS